MPAAAMTMSMAALATILLSAGRAMIFLPAAPVTTYTNFGWAMATILLLIAKARIRCVFLAFPALTAALRVTLTGR
jgi:hypothetical protein